jgi:antitoxin component of RelBE/YafQ-DinJ toxin-antitoxin module
MEKISDFVPKKKRSDQQLIQVKVPRKLKEHTRKVLKLRKLTWNQLVIAAMRQICAEAGQPIE